MVSATRAEDEELLPNGEGPEGQPWDAFPPTTSTSFSRKSHPTNGTILPVYSSLSTLSALSLGKRESYSPPQHSIFAVSTDVFLVAPRPISLPQIINSAKGANTAAAVHFITTVMNMSNQAY